MHRQQHDLREDSLARACLAVCLSMAMSSVATTQVDKARPEQEGSLSDPQRNTGVGPDLNLPEKPQVLWKYAPDGSNFDCVVAFDGTVIALDRQGTIHALDAATGTLAWKSDAGYQFSFGFGLELTRNPDFDALLVGCDAGLWAIERRTGKLLWRTPLPKGVAGPTCTADAVFAGGADGKVYACDLRTGKVKWEHDYLHDRPEDPAGFSREEAVFGGKEARPTQASTDGKTVFLSVFDQCRTLAIDAETGKRRWSFPSKGWMYGRPTVGRRDVYVASQDSCFYAIDTDKGTLTWKVETKARNEAAAAVTRRLVVFGSCDGNVYAAEPLAGGIAWQFATDKDGEAGAPIYSRPQVSHDTVYLPAMRGTIYALELATGKLRWKLEPLPGSELIGDPAVDGGRLYVTTRRRNDTGESAVLAIGRRE